MFTLAGMRKFHNWTHASLALVLEHLATLPASAFTRDLPNFGFPNLRAQVIHIFNCESFWVHILQSANFTDRKPADWPSVSDLPKLQHQVIEHTHSFLARCTEEQLNAPMELHFPDGDRAVRTPALVLHHVLTHAFHHKGQIVAMCRALGYPAPDTDLNQFE